VLVSVETAWLFTRGSESIRIVRAASRSGTVHLIVQGPGGAADTREFTDVLSCMNYQSDLERRLVAEGYTLERFRSERRIKETRGRTFTPERRRMPHLFL
jgi:hypothetical protein